MEHNGEEQEDAEERAALKSDLIPDKAIESAAEDEFQHAPLAKLVADVAKNGEAPLNIALYGSWGSGKSSFFALLKEKLDDSVGVIKYNAWKYSGEALQRRFILDAAEQLGIDPPEMYATRQGAELGTKPGFWGRLKSVASWTVTSLLPVVVVGLIGLIVLAVLYAEVSDDSVRHVLRKLFNVLVAPAALIAMLVWAGRFLSDELITKVQAGPPGEEQLEDVFKTVLQKARSDTKIPLVQKRYKRFVFFVDELDRCAPDEVVETLAAIRNFLDQPDCVFIVAADRDVLEEALTALPQSNPANDDAPYYSSASEFLDKIFQTQLSLPPLRDQRRTRFARDLVLQKESGIWKDIRDVGQGVLDDVVFVLIPPHVRSPRRIKVLLNNFAMNVRTVQARGLEWKARATEIAKLTVFQTELPLFAADLHVESRLPELMLDGADLTGRSLSSRSQRVVDKHRLSPAETSTAAAAAAAPVPATTSADDGDEELVATDRLLTSGRHERSVLIGVQREQLKRYLETRARFPNPLPDLLYLEDVGKPFGLSDHSLAVVLEVDAPDDPQAAIAALEGRADDELQAVIRLLASMIPQHIGPEQENVFTTLIEAAELVPDATLETIGVEVSNALGSYLDDDRTIPTDVLAGALRVAAVTHAGGLTDRILEDDRFDADAYLLAAAARLAPMLDEGQRQATFARVATSYAEGEEAGAALLAAVTDLPAGSAVELLDEATIWETIKKLETVEAGEAFEALFVAAENREDSIAAVQRPIQWHALQQVGGYVSARKRAAVVLSDPGNADGAARHAIAGLAVGPSEDWEYWVRIADGATPATNTVELTTKALVQVVSTYRAASPAERQAALDVVRVVAIAGLYDGSEAKASAITDALGADLASANWWSTAGGTAEQASLHALGASIAAACPHLRPKIEELLEADLERSLSPAPSGQALQGIAQMGPTLAPDGLERLGALCADAQPLFPGEALAARLLLARAIRDQGGTVGVSNFGVDEVRVAREAGTADVLDAWLKLDPDTPDVVVLAGELALSATQTEVDAFAAWAHRMAADDRADLINSVVTGSSDGVRWIEKIPPPIAEERVVDHIAELAAAPRSDERDTAVRALNALHPQTPEAQRGAADIVIQLLKRKKKADFETALRALRAVGTGHQSKKRLVDALKATSTALKVKIPKRYLADLRAAGLDVPNKYVEEPKKGIRKRLGL